MEPVIGSVWTYVGKYDPELRGRKVVVLALYRVRAGIGFIREDERIGDVEPDDLLMVAALRPGEGREPRPAAVIFAAGSDELEPAEDDLER